MITKAREILYIGNGKDKKPVSDNGTFFVEYSYWNLWLFRIKRYRLLVLLDGSWEVLVGGYSLVSR